MINICSDVYLDADANQFILYEWDGTVSIHKDGRIQNNYKSTKYYSQYEDVLEGLLRKLSRRDVRNSQTLQELFEKQQATVSLIRSMSSSIKSFCDNVS